MKLGSSFATLSKLLLVVMAALSLTGATNVQAATLSNQITIQNQDVNTNMVVVDSVTATRDGWIVLYRNPNLIPDEVVGHAWVHQGVNMGVKVVVNMPAIGNPPVLWAVLQADNGVPGLFEWGNDNRAFDDAPFTQNGQVTIVAFATRSNPAPEIAKITGASTSGKAPADQITIHNQDITSGIILVDSVTTDQDGWVVIYREPNFGSGEIVGYAPVYRGTNTNVKVSIDTSKLTDQTTLWAQLHQDTGLQGTFEWGNNGRPFSDYPVIQNNRYITTSFATTATPSPMSTTASTVANQITVHNQALDTGVIVIDSVTAAQNGWVVIYREPNFGSGAIVGYAPVYKGTNLGVKVTVDRTKLADTPTLWAVLHIDGGLQSVFEWGYKGRAFADPPVFEKGAYVAAGFGTTGP